MCKSNNNKAAAISNVFPVPGDGNCFFHSLSFILNGDFSMSKNYRQLICTFILQNWASWEDRILISHEHNTSPGTGKTLNLVSFIEMLEDGKVGDIIATDL
jgi:hypothetical protein